MLYMLYEYMKAWRGPQGDSSPDAVTGQLQPDTSRTHSRPSDPRTCPWLVLACLACAAMFWALNFKKNVGTYKVFSSPRLLWNLKPRRNELSSPGMMGYLARSSVWPAPENTFRGLNIFFPTNSFLNLIPCQHELSSPGMV